MAANGSGLIQGVTDIVELNDVGPHVLEIDSSSYLTNISVSGNTFRFSAIGQQVCTITLKPVGGTRKIPYTIQLYNVMQGRVDAYSLVDVDASVAPQLQTVPIVLNVTSSSDYYSLRLLINAPSGENSIQLAPLAFSMVITTLASSGGGGGSGTVTDVGLDMPVEFTVSGSPVTTSGTLTASWAAQAQNSVLCGPTSGSGTPGFRSLVSYDIPNLSASKITSGTLSASVMPALTGDVTTSAGSVATSITANAVTNAKLAQMTQATIKGRAAGAGTGDPVDLTATQATAILDVFVGDSGSGGTKGLVPAPAAGDAIYFLRGDGTWAANGSGTVTSVGLSLPSEFTVTGSPVTGSGTLTGSWANQSANIVFAGPSTGSPAAPAFRSLVADDIPGLPASKITSGQLSVANGGTGLDGSAASNGTLLIGNGTGYSLATLTQGGGVTITSGSGTITFGTSAFTGDVTTSANSFATTIGANKVVNSMLAQMAQSTFKGRAAASGTGDPVDLTATQATAILNNFVGDSGAGGTKGLVIAPSAGDATKFLRGDATWADPTGTVSSVALSLPTAEFTVSGSPVTSTGTLTGTWKTQSANIVFAGPSSGGAATPAFRSLVANDIPGLPASQITSGQLAIARGGTNSGAALSGSTIMISDGSAIVQGSAGTSTQVLHGNASGAPTYSAVSLTADVSGILPSANGGTANGFTKFSGPATSEKTFTLPNASATVLTDNTAVTVAQGGTGNTSATAYAVQCGGATSTGAHQSVSGVGTSGQVLTSNGAGALPTWQDAIPTGTVMMYISSTAPSGWLNCDGSAVSRTTYSALFAIISTTYGAGNGSTTFNLPDMRGRAPVGTGTGTGGGSSGTGAPTGGSALTNRALGAWLGEETHTLTGAESGIAAHSHTTWNGGTYNLTTGATPVQLVGSASAGTTATGTTGATNAANAHQNMQPVMTVNFIIKT